MEPRRRSRVTMVALSGVRCASRDRILLLFSFCRQFCVARIAGSCLCELSSRHVSKVVLSCHCHTFHSLHPFTLPSIFPSPLLHGPTPSLHLYPPIHPAGFWGLPLACNAIPICETFKISCLMGRLHPRDVLGNHL